MSKATARAAAAANGNSQTSSNQPASNSQAQAAQPSQGQQTNGQAPQQTDNSADATDKVAICLEKLTELSADHEKTLSDHENRLKALEEALAKIRQSNQTASPTGTSASAPTPTSTPVPTPASTSAPAPTASQQPKSATVKPGNGYTGKALVFFIHGEDGDLDWSLPLYSPNVAKYYDWNYRIIPAWVENGVFVRPLKPEEAAGVDW